MLAGIGAADNPELLVFNKADAADDAALVRLRNLHPEAAVVSATTGEGIEALRESIRLALEARTVELELVVPYDRGDLLAELHDAGSVLTQEHGPDGTSLRVRVPEPVAAGLRAFAQSRSSTP